MTDTAMPTIPAIRYVKRDGRLVLQREVTITDAGGERSEWRDVPAAEAQPTYTPVDRLR